MIASRARLEWNLEEREHWLGERVLSVFQPGEGVGPGGLEISGRDISFEQPRMRGDGRSPHAPETVTRFVPHRLGLVVEQANEPIGAGGAETDGFEKLGRAHV